MTHVSSYYTPRPRDVPGSGNVDYDVIIAGGGLAGLCLSKQLVDADPDLSVLVLDRMLAPLPPAAFKVGESTVEVGAYYMSHVVGLRYYLDQQHLEKLGLRYFYAGERQFTEEPEFGVRRFLPVKSYQLDRGTLEEHLRQLVASCGVHLAEGQRVIDICPGEAGQPHQVLYRSEGEEGAAVSSVSCRWVVDATGRRRLLQRKLGLTKAYPRRHNAVWFRLAGRLDIDEVAGKATPDWHERIAEPRWHSTNHLMFAGGWIWLIPLFPDNTSVGIVTAEELHPISAFNKIDKAVEFIDQRVPGLGDAIRSFTLLDFRVLRNYSHSSRQVFSTDRWACVGDAGVFVDPYYSVGSNMIAYGNGLITKMITDDTAGQLDADFVSHANRWFLSLAENLTNGIQSAYLFHDNAVIMVLKTIWDFYVGWTFSDPQYYDKTFLDPAASLTLSGLGAKTVAAQSSVIRLLTDWSRQYRGVFEFDYIDYYDDLPTLAQLFVENLPAPSPRPFDDVLRRVRASQDRIEELAQVIFYLALQDAFPDLLPKVRSAGWLNVAAISLDPSRWEDDGLFKPRSRPRPQAIQALEKELRGLFRLRPDPARSPRLAA